jgi:6,7-dimethyl-8-ribityllumazine synthase
VVHEFEGSATPVDGRYAIVVSRYNESVTGKLLGGALATLRGAGVADDCVDVVWVPGAFEIPLAASRMANRDRCAAVICLGAVIRGETTHDMHINRAVSLSLASISAEQGVPVLFGVLTCDSLEQAISRAGGQAGNKGIEAAEAALRMADLMKKLSS